MAPKKTQEGLRRSERQTNLITRSPAPKFDKRSTGRGEGTKHQGYRGDNESDQDDQEVDETDQDNEEVDGKNQGNQGARKDGQANRTTLTKEAAQMLYKELEKYGPEYQERVKRSNQAKSKRRLTNSLSSALTTFRDNQRYDDYKELRKKKTFSEVKDFVENDIHPMKKAALIRSIFKHHQIADSMQGHRVQEIVPSKPKPKTCLRTS